MTLLTIKSRKTGIQKSIEIDDYSTIEFHLYNGYERPCKCTIDIGHHVAYFGVEGYSSMTDSDEDGSSVGLDMFHHNMPLAYYAKGYAHPSAGHAQVLLWDDINDEEPRTLPLTNARIGERRE